VLPLALWGGIVAGLAFFLYLPTRQRPFDLLDFSEFLPLLTAHNSWSDQFLALARYYLQDQGRTNVLPYGAITLKWGLFGNSVVSWQLARFIQMLIIVAGVYHLCRRLGASWSGAGWGSLLLVTAGSATDAWTRLTTGEPLGLMFLLAALGMAERFQQNPRWQRRANAIAMLLAGMVLCKETLVAAVPFLLAIAWCRQPDGTYAWSGRSTRNIGLAVRTLGVMMILGLAIALIAANAHTEAFASQYGRETPSFLSSVVTFVLFLLPSRTGLEPASASLPANLAFLALVGQGWWLQLRRDRPSNSTAILLGALLLFPLAGTLVYAPWPLRELFYGLPFMITPAVLLARAVTSVEQRGGVARWLAQLTCAGIVAFTALQAHHLSRYKTARQEVNYSLATTLASLAGGDSGFVALKSTFAEGWRGPGPALMRYGRLMAPTGVMPIVVNVRCDDIPRILSIVRNETTRALISYSNTCGPLPNRSHHIAQGFVYYDPARWSLKLDSLGADVIILPATEDSGRLEGRKSRPSPDGTTPSGSSQLRP
jgi:hypothetical protein